MCLFFLVQIQEYNVRDTVLNKEEYYTLTLGVFVLVMTLSIILSRIILFMIGFLQQPKMTHFIAVKASSQKGASVVRYLNYVSSGAKTKKNVS